MIQSELEIVGIPTGEIIKIRKSNITYFVNNDYVRYVTNFRGYFLNEWAYLSDKKDKILEMNMNENLK